jgi:hypothetical protein
MLLLNLFKVLLSIWKTEANLTLRELAGTVEFAQEAKENIKLNKIK